MEEAAPMMPPLLLALELGSIFWYWLLMRFLVLRRPTGFWFIPIVIVSVYTGQGLYILINQPETFFSFREILQLNWIGILQQFSIRLSVLYLLFFTVTAFIPEKRKC